MAQRYGTAEPTPVAIMSNEDQERYEHALATWLTEHPFRSGHDDVSPSVVFDAVITGHALRSPSAADVAAERELQSGANPFVSVFYPQQAATTAVGSEPVHLPAEHIGIVYNSVRARLTLAETASLLVTERGDQLEGEVTIGERDEKRPERTVMNFRSHGTGTVRLGSHVADAEIDVPGSRVEIGTGSDVILVAPVNIDCDDLRLEADRFVVEAPPRERFASAVVLKGHTATPTISGTPILRRHAHLCVSWPESHVYPWRPFAIVSDGIDEQHVKEGLQGLRRLVMAFRARGKDQLARTKDKIDSQRMMKGRAPAVLEALMEEKIMHIDGRLYILDASALGGVVGVTYLDCAKQQFPERAIAFVNGITTT